MENRTNQIMSLETGRDYFINRQILYKGVTYYVATLVKKELAEDGTLEPEDEIVIFEEREKDGKKTVIVLEDEEIAKIILKNL